MCAAFGSTPLTDDMSKFRPGDTVTYCGLECKVASIFRGEAELTTMTGTLIDYIPVGALHKVATVKARSQLKHPSEDEIFNNGLNVK